MANEEYRPDLPGTTTPPVQGRQWLWVKLGVWAVILILAAIAAAFVASVLVG